MSRLLLSPVFKKGLSFTTFILILIFLFGLINIEHSVLGISEPLFEITKSIKLFFDVIFWIIVGLLFLELITAYLEIGNTKSFLKKYWLEIILLVFMPLFVGFKALKLSFKIIKQIKISKTGFKVLQKLLKKIKFGSK